MSNSYDIVVIGAGIHGVGVAQASVACGWKTLLLEKREVAAGTSSKSSKLIHGGLRYLESMQFSLVRECLRERELLLRIAPDIVRSVDFYIPVYKHTRRRPWQIATGLKLYDWLARATGDKRSSKIPVSQWSHLDGLTTQNLQAVYCYHDAQTDDAALCRAVLQSAMSLGARYVCPAQVVAMEVSKSGVQVNIKQGDQAQSIHTKCVVNATGPWVNRILNAVVPAQVCMPVDLVQGTHIVVPKIVSKSIYYVEAPQDRRAVFVMPWRDHSLIGTTETVFSGDPDAVAPLQTEIDYLLHSANAYFNEAHLNNASVLESFAGLRVLPTSQDAHFKRSRDTVLWVDNEAQPKLLSVYGGKLTAYRATAQRVVQRLAARLPMSKKTVDTCELMLTLSD